MWNLCGYEGTDDFLQIRDTEKKKLSGNLSGLVVKSKHSLCNLVSAENNSEQNITENYENEVRLLRIKSELWVHRIEKKWLDFGLTTVTITCEVRIHTLFLRASQSNSTALEVSYSKLLQFSEPLPGNLTDTPVVRHLNSAVRPSFVQNFMLNPRQIQIFTMACDFHIICRVKLFVFFIKLGTFHFHIYL